MMVYEQLVAHWRLHRRTLLFASMCIFLGAIWPASFGDAQVSSTSLTITSPAAGTVVVPGQGLQVSVSVAAGANFKAVQVIGEDIGISPPKQTPPYLFTLTIPNNVIGIKEIAALGIVGPDNGIFSKPVTVDVETQTPLTSLSVTPARVNLSVGKQLNLTVTGKFSDGSQQDITRSSNVSYQTGDAAVVTASVDGVLTAVGPGTTGVLVKYGDVSAPVPVAVVGVAFAGTAGSADCRGKSVSALAQQYGGLAQAANALGYPSVRALQDAIRAYCRG